MKNAYVFVFLFSGFLSSKIHEIKTIDEVKNYIKPDTLIIFDLDNTVFEASQTLGSDQWFVHRKTQIDAQTALDEWTALQYIIQLKPVEPVTVSLLKSLQKEKNPVMALTTRGKQLANITLQRLKELDIHFPNSPHKGQIDYTNQREIQYIKGILFTDGTDKGSTLRMLLNKIGYTPKVILFVNDKKDHLEPVWFMCKKYGIEFIGLRYAFLDTKVENFNSEVAKIQWEMLTNVLSDNKAHEILKTQKSVKISASGDS